MRRWCLKLWIPAGCFGPLLHLLSSCGWLASWKVVLMEESGAFDKRHPLMHASSVLPISSHDTRHKYNHSFADKHKVWSKENPTEFFSQNYIYIYIHNLIFFLKKISNQFIFIKSYQVITIFKHEKLRF